ncbi:hypothetical protein AB0N38_18715 [Micromonospora aurantiaca]|uniref:Uncharacterized protein n=1 Tax=Micromonospora aurantiaca (nom. illeg.) TaxID=47850 RepID=A0A6N3JV91_9ACTN|nr:hypothetical protein [Micromonospora aurantiaca]AXH88816.1 hypothetical protein DVH21_02105 [Micromonospora aurantiaca]KAB1111986.1 hypothetical protein F6X54_16050 [Micromonospora aurantiaca]
MSQTPPEWQPPRSEDPIPPISSASRHPAHTAHPRRREWWPFVLFGGISLLVLGFVLLVVVLAR